MQKEHKEPEFRALLIALANFACVNDFSRLSNLITLVNEGEDTSNIPEKVALLQQSSRISLAYFKYMQALEDNRKAAAE